MTTFALPNGHKVRYAEDKENPDAYYVEILDEGDIVIQRSCCCNGACVNCPDGQSVRCNCTTNPPTVWCG